MKSHLQSLYLTACEKCGHETDVESFIWRKGEAAPFARVYECKECGDKGERAATPEDGERARKIAATDALHRARAFERVAAMDDEDRSYAQEAIQHYLPRPLYVLTTIINRLDSLKSEPRTPACTHRLNPCGVRRRQYAMGIPNGKTSPQVTEYPQSIP